MKKKKRLFVLALSLLFSTVSYAADDVDVLVALLKANARKASTAVSP